MLTQYKGRQGNPLDLRTANSRISNCKRVEFYEGNLDQQFEDDRLEALLSRLNYTKADATLGQPLRHKIPINGNWHNGTATLKSAVELYSQFRSWQENNQSAPPITGQQIVKPNASKTDWPQWELPSSGEELALARIVARYARFLEPEIVKQVVDDNERHRAIWTQRLKERGINHESYIWPRSSCAFPGVRRHSGSREIAIFKKQSSGEIDDALALDDNDHPKHLWSFVLTGKKFQKRGPFGYALAHLADHKKGNKRIFDEFLCTDNDTEVGVEGLFTAPTNTCYIPTAILRPTDFSLSIRDLLIRRATHLYKDICELWPPQLSLRESVKDGWELDQFEWTDFAGDVKRTVDFLEFRQEVMVRLFET